jgi:putative selenium metabolism protein SsnA
MAIVLENALLTDLDPLRVEAGSLRLDGGRIVARGATVPHAAGDEVVDCGGAVVLPGLVNGHAHLYSALACGMPQPPQTPHNFPEILQYVWWRLDRALDAESNELSAQIGALDAIHCGTTTLIDHHASPDCIPHSLDHIEQGLARVGLRGVLCYETTDRNGIPGRAAGLAENRRYLEKCAARPEGRYAGLVGAHALFTLEDYTLTQLAILAAEWGSGVHIHVAEDPSDEAACEAKHHSLLIDRLANYGLIQPESVFAHGTHIDAEAAARIGAAGVTIAHCPRSNMNNGVGYTPVAAYRGPVMLGTDGIGGDMFAEARAAWWIACHQHAGLSPQNVLQMLANSARRASMALGVTLGKLAPEAVADVVLTDYRPATPLTSDNLAGHFLFGLAARHVASVLVDGRWVLRSGTVQTCDEASVRRTATKVAGRMWERMAKIK